MPKTVLYKTTGPATVKIFEPTPSTYPSLLLSRATEAMEFANPVTGTRVPAPAIWAILSYKPTQESNAPIKIRVTVTRR